MSYRKCYKRTLREYILYITVNRFHYFQAYTLIDVFVNLYLKYLPFTLIDVIWIVKFLTSNDVDGTHEITLKYEIDSKTLS